MTTHTKTLLALTAMWVAACGGGDDDPGVDSRCTDAPTVSVYEPGMIQAGEDGVFEASLIEAVPAPPSKGDNDWLIEVRTIGGAAIPDAGIKVTPFMPDHGHGTGLSPIVTPGASPGVFDVDRINLWMPGLWEVYIDAATPAGSDRITFSFCIEG